MENEAKNLIVPKVEYNRYGGQTDEYHKAVNAFYADATNYLNSILSANWAEYIEFGWQDKDWRSNHCFVLKTKRSYSDRTRVFCKIEKGKEFVLTAKHIANITEYLNQKVAAANASRKRADNLASLKNLVEPVIGGYRNDLTDFNVSLDEIAITTIESKENYWQHRLSVSIHRRIYRDSKRNGYVGEVRVPAVGGHSDTTIARIEAHIAKYRGRAEALATLANQIANELPKEFFE